MEKSTNTGCALQLKNIDKIYGTGENAVHALKKANISFRKSELVSVLGPSGCGKTTMLNIVGGLDRYTEGDLLINGVSTMEFKDSDWDTYRNNSIGFIFQSYNLIPHQTVLSNVELALTLSGVSKAERHERAKDVLKKVGLEDQYNKRPSQLSGGQMQRVAIARALINNPEIILADEPTGALDSETSEQVMELIKEVAKDRLVIMVTHNPALAEAYSTRTITLLDGEITGDTNPYVPEEDCAEPVLCVRNGGIEENSVQDTCVEACLACKDKNRRKSKRVKLNKGKKKKSSMNFITALVLSLSNLRTKKGRTVLTSIAGSIGIIGIALVLAVSTGFSGYINKLQADTLSVYPVTITEATIDLTDFEKLTNQVITDEVKEQRFKEKVYSSVMFSNLSNMLKSNKLTEEYIADYVEPFIEEANNTALNTADKWQYCLQKGYGFSVDDYLYSNIQFSILDSVMPIEQLLRYFIKMFNDGMLNSNMNISAGFVRDYIPTVSEIPKNHDLVASQYELLYGDWATEEDQLLLVVDKYNRVSDITLALLGFNDITGIDLVNYGLEFGEKTEFTFAEAIGKPFYYLKNDNRFVKNADGSYYDKTFMKSGNNGDLSDYSFTPDMTLKISGIVRLKEGLSAGVLETGIAYTSQFVDRILQDNIGSAIAQDAASKVDSKFSVRVYSWHEDDPAMSNFVLWQPAMAANLKTGYDLSVRQLAGDNTVNKLSIYSVDYEAKENLKAYLDAYNEVDGRLEEDKVHYSDTTAMLFTALNIMVDAVKIVLICFTSISLVVSSIMIGIITYVSVVERTKEIGVLRAIGARKKDISRIFNAESFLIGLFAGILGIAVTYLITIPINLIVGMFIANAGAIASLNLGHALILVVVSFVLTLIAGIIPARIAAKKDPVVALRSE